MANVDLEALGLDAQRIEDRVVETIVENLCEGVEYDTRIQELVQQRIDAAVETIAAKHVLPNLQQYIEEFALQETNQWGEVIGRKQTFTEYLVKRANDYLREEVNYEGKTKRETGSFGWHGKNPRDVHLIDQHLHYHISDAMKTAVRQINESISGGLEEAVKASISRLQKSLKVSVEVKDHA